MRDQPHVLPADDSVIEEPPRYGRRLASFPKQALVSAILPIVTAVIALLCWEILVTRSGIAESILPPPTAVLSKLYNFLGLILTHSIPTTLETLVAFGISIPLGIVLAAIMVYSKPINQALYANLVVFQLIPKIALAPLFIVWLGIGAEARIAFSVFICFHIFVQPKTMCGVIFLNQNNVSFLCDCAKIEWNYFNWIFLIGKIIIVTVTSYGVTTNHNIVFVPDSAHSFLQIPKFTNVLTLLLEKSKKKMYPE